MWDTGTSLSFITNAKARAENLTGINTQLSIIKVKNVKPLAILSTSSHLLASKKKTIVFDVYGTDKITSSIPSVDIQGISKLFKDVHEKELRRSTGEVDILIGYEYANFHTLKEQNSGHLLFLRDQVGR